MRIFESGADRFDDLGAGPAVRLAGRIYEEGTCILRPLEGRPALTGVPGARLELSPTGKGL